MKKFIFPLLVCILLIIAIFLYFFGYSNCIIIRSYDTNKILYKSVLKPNMMIEFSYIHSVSLTPIHEYLEVSTDGYILRKVVYIDQGGAGMPEFAYDNQEFTMEDGKFVLSGFDRFYETIVINAQQKYDDTITIDDQTIDLYSLLGENGRIILDVEKSLILK